MVYKLDFEKIIYLHILKMSLKDKLSEDEKVIYDDLYIKSKELYPNLLEDMYEQVIVYYIKSGMDDDCFNKLIKQNENKKSSIDLEKLTVNDNETNEVLSTC